MYVNTFLPYLKNFLHLISAWSSPPHQIRILSDPVTDPTMLFARKKNARILHPRKMHKYTEKMYIYAKKFFRIFFKNLLTNLFLCVIMEWGGPVENRPRLPRTAPTLSVFLAPQACRFWAVPAPDYTSRSVEKTVKNVRQFRRAEHIWGGWAGWRTSAVFVNLAFFLLISWSRVECFTKRYIGASTL